MQTVFTKKIDNLDVVLGIDFERIDQISTAKKIRPLVMETKEFKAFNERQKKISVLREANASLLNQGREVMQRVSVRTGKIVTDIKNSDLQENEISLLQKYDNRRANNLNEIEIIQKALPKVNKKLKEKTDKIMRENAMFFNLKDGESKISDKQANDFKQKLKTLNKNQFLLVDGAIITDYRNKVYYAKIDDKWDKWETSILGESPDLGLYHEFKDLLEEERAEIVEEANLERISGLSAEEKKAEKESLLDGLASQAALMKYKLEIQGNKNALSESQKWYKEEVFKVEKKYK